MSLSGLRIFALLALALSIPSHAQSLGDVARQTRAERQKNGTPHARIITNEDLNSQETVTALPQDASAEAAQDTAGNEGEEALQGANSAEGAKKGTNTGADEPKTAKHARKDSVSGREAQELETQKRTQEINRVYLDRIATLRTQLNTAQSELGKLQQGQLESTFEFRRTLGVSPNPGTYEQQQRSFNDQIQSQRNLINSLNSQLEDSLEAARHAGVPHASD